MGDLTRDFSRSEFACKCGCGADNIDLGLVNQLQRLRSILRVPIVIRSGVRCASYNATVGGKPTSAHVTGEAADLACNASHTRWLMQKAIHSWSLFNRIGIGDSFLHVDVSRTLPQEVEWTYPEEA